MNKIVPLTILTLLICLQLSNGQTENLVLNPSFEQFEVCPQHYTPQDRSHELIPFWKYPTMATPDYFNTCSHGVAGVPKNFAGVSEPKTGRGYMGLLAVGSIDKGKINYREYIQGQLKLSLEKGQKYCVTFSYKLATYSKYAVDRLGLVFSPHDLTEEKTIEMNKSYISRTPHVENERNNLLENKETWNTICGIYVANGTENFLAIGNFYSIKNTDTLVVDPNVANKFNKSYAYYYIDDVSVIPLVNCLECECVPQDLNSSITKSSFTGGVNLATKTFDEAKTNDGTVEIEIKGGTPPYKIEWSTGSSALSISNLSEGIYSYKVTDQYNCISRDSVIFVTPELPDEFMDRLRQIGEGEAIVLENIFFDFDKTELLPKSYIELDKLINFMQELEIKQVEISGHTDAKGSDAYNQKLSEGRAKAVVEYLISQGVEKERMTYVGFGEVKPIETNETDVGRARNRRVEFKLTKK